MTLPIVSEINCATGEKITREMNEAEFNQYTADELAQATAQAEEEDAQAQIATDKAALLGKLGITADEAKLLVS